MKILMALMLAAVAGCDDGEPEIHRDAGGLCEYDTIQVEATVVELDRASADWRDCSSQVTRALQMREVESGEPVLVYGRQAALELSAQQLEDAGLTLGSTHALRYDVITQGSCSPEILEFVDADLDFDSVTCTSER